MYGMTVKEYDISYGDLRLDRKEFYHAMEYGDDTPGQGISDMLDDVLMHAAAICRPKIMFGICSGTVLSPARVEAEGLVFHPGKIIADSLAGADRFCFFTATAGTEYENWRNGFRKSGDLVMEFIADAVGSVLAEACSAKVEEYLGDMLDVPFTYPYSPGYCGWRLTDQKLLFSLFPHRPCGIELTDSCLMYPIKSVSGIIGIGENVIRRPYGCAICTLKSCYKRRIQN